MPDWDRLQRFVEYQYSHGMLRNSFSTQGERTPEQMLSAVQNRTHEGMDIMRVYDGYVQEALRRGKFVEGY
jgi:hypothetical protein